MALSHPLHGIVPPLVTPLVGEDELDGEGLVRLIEHVLGGGVHGVFVLGTTGEGPCLSNRLQREMVKQTVQHVAGRVPVLVGVSHPSRAETLSLSNFAADHGADAVVLAPPFYMPIGQDEFVAYVERLAPQFPLPWFLYNMPSHVKLHCDRQTVLKVLELSGIAGVKDSSGNMVYFHRLLEMFADRPDLSLLMGPEELMAEATLLGAAGGVCGGANVWPKLYVDLYQAAKQGDVALVRSLQAKVLQVTGTFSQASSYGGSFIASLKTALHLLGICQAQPASPLLSLTAAEREFVAQRMKSWDMPETVDQTEQKSLRAARLNEG